jgi:hypothetical protein
MGQVLHRGAIYDRGDRSLKTIFGRRLKARRLTVRSSPLFLCRPFVSELEFPANSSAVRRRMQRDSSCERSCKRPVLVAAREYGPGDPSLLVGRSCNDDVA